MTDFDKACQIVVEKHDEFSDEDLTELYGLYKRATCGKCNIKKPSFYERKECLKYEAWLSQNETDENMAKRLYIKKVKILTSV